MNVSMTVNGEQVSGDVEPRQLLVHFIRETLGLKGTHWGCDTTSCGACVVQAPKVFRLDARGKAEVHTPVQTWSPVDGAYLLNCPTYAISVQPEDSAA